MASGSLTFNPLEIKRLASATPAIPYSDQALIDALRQDNRIIHRQFQFFVALFSGGDRFGICYLYEADKQYGFVMVFHYASNPRMIDVNGGTAHLMQPATS